MLNRGWYFDPAFARSHYKPISNNLLDLGSTTRAFRNAYLGTSIVYTGTSFSILANTSDASDNAVINIAGGGAATNTRGGSLKLYGNEFATYGGGIYLEAGAVSTGNVWIRTNHASSFIYFDLNNTSKWVMDGSGYLRGQGTTMRIIGQDSTNRTFLIAADSNGSAAAYLTLLTDATQGGSLELLTGAAANAVATIGTRSASGSLRFQTASTERLRVNSTGQFIFYPAATELLQSTSDGSDSSAIHISGGGALSSIRGAGLSLYGNEAATYTGKAELFCGNVSGAKVSLYTAGTQNVEVTLNGTLRWVFDGSTGDLYPNSTGVFLGSTTKNVGAIYLGNNTIIGFFSYSSGNSSIVFGTSSNHAVEFRTNNNRRWYIDTSGVLTQDATNGSDIVGNATLFGIRLGTSNGSDNKRLGLGGGGAIDPARGAYAYFHGNEFSSNPGSIYLNSGDISGANINYSVISTDGYHRFFVNGGATERLQVKVDGVCLGGVSDFGGGTGVVSIKNSSVNPSSNPSGGGVLYSDAGALKWRGSSGTITTIAAA